MPRTISIKTLLLSVVFLVLAFPSFAAQLSYSCSYYIPASATMPPPTRIPRAMGAAHFLTVPDYTFGAISPSTPGMYDNVSLNNASGPTGNGCSNPINGSSYTVVSATISGGIQGTTQALRRCPRP